MPVGTHLAEAVRSSDAVVVPLPADAAHATEQRPGERVVEVYQAYQDADGTTAVAELYLITQTDGRIRELLGHTLPVAVGGPVLLAILTFPLALRLARRAAAAEASRRELLEQALAVSERERRQLATLLHDGPVQDLAALALRLERRPASSFDREDAANHVRAQIGRLRALLDDLHPLGLEDADLLVALQAIADRDRGDVAVTVGGDALDGLAAPVRELVYRCGAELLHNALAHAGAEHVTAQVSAVGGQVTLRVSDDGSGFDPSVTPGGHYGLKLVRAAVEEAGGWTTVASGPGGTEVTLSLPGQK